MKIVKVLANGTLETRDANGQIIRPTLLPRSTDLASLIQRFQDQVASVMTDLEASTDLSVEKKAATLKTLASTLPMLEQAELARETRIGKKNIKDLTSGELKKLAAGILAESATLPEADEE